jgi:hypothetical protein
MIGVRLSNGKRIKGMPALVDSGCDVTLAHTDIGTLIGLDVLSGRPYNYTGSVVGNAAPAHVHTVHLTIVNYASLDLDIAFSDEMPEGFILLGQRGLFENYDIKFSLSRGFFEIVKLPGPRRGLR